MRATTSIGAILSVMVMPFALASAAQATAARTWVSSAGLDSNASSNCPRTAPCKTFEGAYGATQPGGEIDALDVAGYGPITITGPLTIVGLDGALITVPSSTIGVTINAGASDFVILRNIQIVGTAGSSSTTGIKLNTGKLILQNSTLRGLTDGLIADSTGNSNSVIRAYTSNTDFIGNTRAVTANGTGVNIAGQNPPRSGNVEVLLAGGNVLGNTTAFRMNSPGNTNPGSGNNFISIFLEGPNNVISVNIQGNTTVTSGGPSSDCPFANSCTQVSTYGPVAGNPEDPSP